MRPPAAPQLTLRQVNPLRVVRQGSPQLRTRRPDRLALSPPLRTRRHRNPPAVAPRVPMALLARRLLPVRAPRPVAHRRGRNLPRLQVPPGVYQPGHIRARLALYLARLPQLRRLVARGQRRAGRNPPGPVPRPRPRPRARVHRLPLNSRRGRRHGGSRLRRSSHRPGHSISNRRVHSRNGPRLSSSPGRSTSQEARLGSNRRGRSSRARSTAKGLSRARRTAQAPSTVRDPNIRRRPSLATNRRPRSNTRAPKAVLTVRDPCKGSLSSGRPLLRRRLRLVSSGRASRVSLPMASPGRVSSRRAPRGARRLGRLRASPTRPTHSSPGLSLPALTRAGRTALFRARTHRRAPRAPRALRLRARGRRSSAKVSPLGSSVTCRASALTGTARAGLPIVKTAVSRPLGVSPAAMRSRFGPAGAK